MNWLFPEFLAGALAVGLPLALHLLRRWPRRPVVFPSLVFLTTGSRRAERWSQRLQRWLVLLLRCAILALLAAAFARPFRGGDLARQSRAVVIVVDNSFSLQARGRWDELRPWARDQAGTFAPGDKLGLMVMAPEPQWLGRAHHRNRPAPAGAGRAGPGLADRPGGAGAPDGGRHPGGPPRRSP